MPIQRMKTMLVKIQHIKSHITTHAMHNYIALGDSLASLTLIRGEQA